MSGSATSSTGCSQNRLASPPFYKKTPAYFAVGGLLIPLLWILQSSNYLLYHSLVEMLGIGVAFTVFSIGWNARHFSQNSILLILAIAYLPVGMLDLLHILAYQGMGVFQGNNSNLATQLWISARYIESVSLFGTAFISTRKYFSTSCAVPLLTGFTFSTLLILTSIFALEIFPRCYIEGQGLTTFKITSEYVISGILLAAGYLFWRRKRPQNSRTLYLLLGAIATTILSELSFTLYVDVYGFFNFLGHFFKVFFLILVYRALVHGSLMTPYRILFNKLTEELAEHRATEEKLRLANQELDSFAYTVAHDLRNPLVPIISYSQYLHEEHKSTLPQETLDIFQTIESQGKAMESALNDLLSLAKMERIPPPDKPVNVQEVLDEVLISLAPQLAACEMSVNISSVPEAHIPKTFMVQIFENLIENALRYAGKKGSSIRVGGEKQGHRIRFFVEDHGPGVRERDRELIFEVFYRGKEGIGKKGSGIGLATVQKIARYYGGKTWVEETHGGGSTFWVEVYTQTPEH